MEGRGTDLHLSRQIPQPTKLLLINQQMLLGEEEEEEGRETDLEGNVYLTVAELKAQEAAARAGGFFLSRIQGSGL